MKKCCILYNQPGESALADELDILDQVSFVEAHMGKPGIAFYRKGITRNFMDEMAALRDEKPDFVFNLVESLDNKGELLYFIPAILNMYSIPYTGNPLEAMFLTTSKILTGKMLKSNNIPYPVHYLPSQAGQLEKGKKYIVKPVWEDGSMGITADSVFTYTQEYESRISELNDSHWLIQEYIEGREFNISVLQGPDGPEVLPPAEMNFVDFGEQRPKIVDFKAKWDHNSFEYINTVRSFPGNKLDETLGERLRKTTLKTWDVFGLRGYARIDYRVDAEGIPYVIEVNANPCIAEDGGFVAATVEAGYRFPQVIERIVKYLNF